MKRLMRLWVVASVIFVAIMMGAIVLGGSESSQDTTFFIINAVFWPLAVLASGRVVKWIWVGA